MITIRKQPAAPRVIFLTVGWIVFLAVFMLVLNLPWSPVFTGPGPDSGVYAYFGSAIVHGQVPYRDVWEQKPPLGFYLNALAVLLFGQNIWAIWWFNLIWIVLSGIAFFLILKKMFGLLAGMIGSLAFVLAVMLPSIFQGGNLMEIYGFIPQVLTIAFVYYFFVTKQKRWIFLVGVSTGIGFLIKQTTIALGLSSLVTIALITILWLEFKYLGLRLASFVAGFCLPLGIATIYWLAIGAIKEFLAGVFFYSVSYVNINAPFFWSVKHTFLSVFPTMFISKLYYIGAAAFLLYLAENIKWFLTRINSFLRRKPAKSGIGISPVELTLLVVFIALPIEIVFASLGGRNFGHYFLSLIPATATAFAYAVWKVDKIWQNRQFSLKGWRTWLAVSGLLLGLAGLVWMATAMYQEAPSSENLESIGQVLHHSIDPGDIARYIDANTTPDTPILVWNAHATIYFQADRHPPQRVLSPSYFISLASTGGSKSNLAEFLDEVQAHPPQLILVQKVSSMALPFVNVPIAEMCPKKYTCIIEVEEAMKNPSIIAYLEQFRQYFLEHYMLDRQIQDILIYKRIP